MQHQTKQTVPQCIGCCIITNQKWVTQNKQQGIKPLLDNQSWFGETSLNLYEREDHTSLPVPLLGQPIALIMVPSSPAEEDTLPVQRL